MKPVLNKIIHTDQKGFVAGRNISENNRMIDYIIEFVDNEDEEGVIIFVDQQKAFDRMEWGWLNYVMECFNFGLKFREWVYMLFKKGKTCIKTNDFISNFFAISRSARQGCLAAPIVYIIQAEPMACAIRNTPEIHGIKLPDCEGQPVKEAKICMFADDTQLLNKNEESVEQSFLILSKFEKASGSKINYEKTKGLFIGRLRGKRPRLTNISWISDNIKTLGVFHGYNIDTDDIWKKIINKMKSCPQVWKTRNLTFKGKTLIVKNFC